MNFKTTLRTAGVALGFVAAAALPANAADLSGKTVEWTIPFSETGGSAKWANFFAPLLSEHMAGNPNVVVKFMLVLGQPKAPTGSKSKATLMAPLRLGHLVQPSSHTCLVILAFAMNIKIGFQSWLLALGVLLT